MVEDLKYRSEKYGLPMNITKTKFMTNRGGTNELWTEGTKLTEVDDYRYLGQLTKFANNMDGIIREGISNARKAFWANNIIWRSKMKNEQKAKILDSCVMPTLTYGTQTCSLTKRQMQCLIISTQNSMLRNILEIQRRDKIKTTNIQQQTGTVSIGYKIKKTLAQLCCARKAGFLYLLKQQFSFSLKHKY